MPPQRSSFYSSQPPRWFGRALLLTAITVFISIFIWRALGSLTGLLVNLTIALFFALAMEPMIVWLVKHGWKRTRATGVVMAGLLVAGAAILALFGRLFIDQAVQLIKSLPNLYESITNWIENQFSVDIPPLESLQKQILEDWSGELATQAWAVGTSVISTLFSFAMILLVSYYLASAGPKFRASICAWLRPKNQNEVLRLWEITQAKISDYINSRIILSLICSFFTAIFLTIINVPYALPLALFTGVTSQFIPTIGTYIGGALPILFALTTNSLKNAIVVLVFIIVYQQIENMWLSPKISARALEMNAAVSFVVVIAFGAVFGAIGAFLSLPIAATIQAIAGTYLRRHELVDSHLLKDPEKLKKPRAEEHPHDTEFDSQDGASHTDSVTSQDSES